MAGPSKSFAAGLVLSLVGCVFLVTDHALAVLIRGTQSEAAIQAHHRLNDYNQEAEYHKVRKDLERLTPEQVDAAKKALKERQDSELAEEKKMKELKDKVISELKDTVKERGLKEYAERAEDRQDAQQQGYAERKRELQNMDPALRQRLLDKRKREVEEQRKAKKDSDAVVEELKEKLAKRGKRY